MQIFNAKMAEHKAAGKNVFSGADAFLLAATYGFPIDLTVEMVEDEGMTIDMEEYNRQREDDKIRAREARKALGDLGWAGIDFGKDMPATAFVGYENLTNEAKVLAVVCEEELQQSAGEGAEAILVLDQTAMYAEMGGQVADHGTITCGDAVFAVDNVQKNKGCKVMHYGKVVSGVISVGDAVTVTVDADRRHAIMRAHSATHLLQTALRTVLGDHVHQAGSFVEEDHLRFDFTHYSAMTAEEIEKVNALVQEAVLTGYGVDIREMSIEDAKASGATALFSEKYGDTVRVVNMGGYSIELCGGTHLDNTAKVGPFRVVSEASVASGVRRIEAITGKAYVADAAKTRSLVNEVCAAVKVKNPADLSDKLAAQLEEIKALKKEIEAFKAKEASGAVDQMLSGAAKVGAVKVLTVNVPGADAGKLRQMGDVLRDKDESVVAVLASVAGEKVTFLAVCGKAAVKAGVKAGDIVKHVCGVCGGSGGGKPDSAMGGGKDPSKVSEALASVEGFVASKF
jgi:alanyl-tRNA synthetase